MPEPTKWRTYEEVTAHIVNAAADKFGLARVEAKQVLQGKDGANWEIDAKGVSAP